MTVRLTHEQFVIKANKIHSNKYSYPEEYINMDTKINILCQIHGAFEQKPGNHLNGCGCKTCADIKKRTKLGDFLKNANKKHNNFYSYPFPEEYKNTETKISIICPKHGLFRQTPHTHLTGGGCRDCADEVRANLHKKGMEKFVSEANKVHKNKYEYFGEYINTHDKITIKCPKHGFFEQKAAHHVAGSGCPKCKSSISNMELEWIAYLKIPEEYHHIKFKVDGRLIKTDAFDHKTNTIYEFYGDFWHGNPNNPQYPPEEMHPVLKKTYGQLYKETISREQFLKENGYNIITIWQLDWEIIVKSIKNKLSLDNSFPNN
jgi:hypothetical protein